MRAVIQRVNRAAVRVDGEVVGDIDRPGLMVLVGVTHNDGPEQVSTVARKIADLRLMEGVAEDLRGRGLEVATGSFGAHMVIDMEADGPVTILVEAE